MFSVTHLHFNVLGITIIGFAASVSTLAKLSLVADFLWSTYPLTSIL